jgi:DNA-binding transcriptional LysR family regulator
MELRNLTTFRAVAISLSLTRAAAEFGYVQSALTAHVNALVAELDVSAVNPLAERDAI